MAAHGEARRMSIGWKGAAAALAAVLLAASWMVLSMLAGKAGLGKALTAQSGEQASVAQALTRSGVSADAAKVQVLFATPEYYVRTGQQNAATEVDPDKWLVFIATENGHNALAPAPIPKLLVDGRPVNIPAKERILSTSEHHRTRLLRYPREDSSGKAYIPSSAKRIELSWPGMEAEHDMATHTLKSPLLWDWPVKLPSAVAGAAGLSPFAFLLLTAGLFAALSPCLIQLTLYYLSALAGAGATGTGGPADRRRIMMVASMFVLGVTVAYVMGGVLAGYLGRSIAAGSVLGTYGKWIGIASGGVIVWLGLWSVLTSNESAACKMPVPLVGRLAKAKMGPASPFLMGFLMSLGCLQCFGGAIFTSLLLYVGSLGSPGLGALMLFLFSLGVAVPFLGAALAWEKVSARLMGLHKVMPTISVVSGVVMMAFGVLMVVDKFHWVSAVVIRWLPFLQA
jgi:cytochrome c-type biogenesis protein